MHKIALLPKAEVCPTAMMPDQSPSEIVLVVRNLLLISNLKLLIARPDLFIYYCYLVQILFFLGETLNCILQRYYFPRCLHFITLHLPTGCSGLSQKEELSILSLWNTTLSALLAVCPLRAQMTTGSIPAEMAAVPWAPVLNPFPRRIRNTASDAPRGLTAVWY